MMSFGSARPVAIVLLGLMMAIATAARAGAATATLDIPHVHHRPTVDDFVRVQSVPDAHAAGMAMIDGLTQRAPSDGAPVSERTRVYIGYDAEHVYAAFVCFDSTPAAVRGHLAGRERIPDDDDAVALQLDTFGDRKHAYTFQVSAAGVQRDGIWTESAGTWDFSFDAIWTAESRRTSLGYVVLITVPLRSLRFPSAAEQSWGLFVLREIPRKGELAFWPAYSPRVAGRLTQAATVTGMRGARQARNLQLTPYTRAEAARGSMTGAGAIGRPDAGLDAKWVLRNSYVVDATVNPDFSQIESDEPQAIVNERFETLFPEKRPFFLENGGYFETPIPLLFTRRLVDPELGVRVTAKQGRYAVAALMADDRSPGGRESASRATLTVIRATGNVGRNGSIGTFASARQHADRSNRLAGVDGRFALGTNWIGTWQAVTSITTDGGTTVGGGPAYTAGLTREGRSFTYAAEWHDRSAGFVADAGYVPRRDFRSLDQTASYRFRPAGGRLIAWGPDVSTGYVWDRGGMRLDSAVTPRLVFEWAGPATLALFHSVARQRLRPSEVAAVERPLDTDADRSGVEVAFFGFERLVWSAAVSTGDGINLVPLTGRQPDPARVFEAAGSASARLARGLTVDASLVARRLSNGGSGAGIFVNRIWRLKAGYQLTRELGIRVIVQQDRLRTQAAATPLGSYTDAATDVLVTYLVAPGRALFVGVNRYDRTGAARARSDGWQLFAKLSYAFHL